MTVRSRALAFTANASMEECVVAIAVCDFQQLSTHSSRFLAHLVGKILEGFHYVAYQGRLLPEYCKRYNRGGLQGVRCAAGAAVTPSCPYTPHLTNSDCRPKRPPGIALSWGARSTWPGRDRVASRAALCAGRAGAGYSRLAESRVPGSGLKRPIVLGGAGLRHPSLRGPKGLLEEVLLMGCRNLRPREVRCTVCRSHFLRPAAKWGGCQRPCSGCCSTVAPWGPVQLSAGCVGRAWREFVMW